MLAEHLLDHVIKPALDRLPTVMQGYVAEQLLLGTAAHESDCGRYLVQISGPALGVFQVEPATHRDLYQTYLAYRPQLRRQLLLVTNADCHQENMCVAHYDALDRELITNLIYSAMVCRLLYYRKPEPLPDSADPVALGQYWKKHYNSHLGKGTVAKFVKDYRRHVLQEYEFKTL